MKHQNKPFRRICQQALFVFILMVNYAVATAQCKTYKLAANADTINCTTVKGKKQGRWIERTEPLRGNAGFEEEGEYLNGWRDGLWRHYNLMGDVVFMENYKWGLLNGKCQYFTIDGLEHEENWRAIDPEKEYDTIDVADLNIPDAYKQVIIKNEGRSLKQGKWTFYDPRTGFVVKTLSYVRDSLENPLELFGLRQKPATDTLSPDERKKKALANKPQALIDWEKKNAGKKKVVVRDGSTGY